MSSSVRMPPPTVSGMKICSAVRRTTSSMMSRPSWLAVMSRNTSSSAPSFSYRAATSTGSPASRRFTKVRALHHAPAVDIETGNHTLGEHCRTRSGGADQRRLPGNQPIYGELFSLGRRKGWSTGGQSADGTLRCGSIVQHESCAACRCAGNSLCCRCGEQNQSRPKASRFVRRRINSRPMPCR